MYKETKCEKCNASLKQFDDAYAKVHEDWCLLPEGIEISDLYEVYNEETELIDYEWSVNYMCPKCGKVTWFLDGTRNE